MHAPVVGRRGGFQPRDEATHCHFVTSDFALSNEHPMMLQGRGGKSRIYPAGFPPNSGPVLQGGGGIRNNAVYGDSKAADDVVSYGKGNFSAQTQKNDVTVPMSAEAGLFSVEGYAGIGNISDILCSPQQGDDPARQQDEHRNKGGDLFLFDWPELGGLEDFETDPRKFGSTLEIGSNYFDDPMWPSICSPDAQLVPSSHFDNNDPNSSTVANKTAASPILIDLTVSVPDTATDQINMANPMNAQQPSKNKGREAPLNCCSSSEEIEEHFPPLSEAEIFFYPLDDMLVPTSSSNDEIIPSSGATRSGPDELVSSHLPRCYANKKPHATTPDMILDEMAGNPLEMYFPPLTTYEQPEVAMSGTSSTQMQHQLLPQGYFAGDGAALNSSGLEFGPKGRMTSEGGSRESLGSSFIIKAAPVKHAGFQKLQEGMNQLDVGAKTCIRDALYRLANSVERRHCVDQTVGSSGAANRFKTSSVWTETEGSPMDRSVAQLLLQKPLHPKTTEIARQTVSRHDLHFHSSGKYM